MAVNPGYPHPSGDGWVEGSGTGSLVNKESKKGFSEKEIRKLAVKYNQDSKVGMEAAVEFRHRDGNRRNCQRSV
jgi:ribosomal protein L13E